MGEERSREASRSSSSKPKYSIDTLFPGLSNNSEVQTRNSRNSSQRESSSEQQESEISCRPTDEVEPQQMEKVKKVKNSEGKDLGDKKGDRNGDRVECGAGSSGKLTTTYSGALKRKSGTPVKPTIEPKRVCVSSFLGLSKASRKAMFEGFQPWVFQTYGDSAKTKTITKKKYNRIVKTLRGEEINNAENSKFRFWVKAKGFHIGPPPGQLCVKDDGTLLHCVPGEPDLYVPTTFKDGSGIEKPIFKRVAVVEHFFDIIYKVHVETEAKNGKHAGQKRTYRAITEKYSFLPREAVTRFLLQCTECQKRGSPGAESMSNGDGNVVGFNKSYGIDASLSPNGDDDGERSNGEEKSPTHFDINFGFPFTTCYLREQGEQMRSREGFVENECEEGDRESKLLLGMSQSTGRKKLVPSKVKVKARAPITRDETTSGEDEQDMRVKVKGSSGSGKGKGSSEGKDVDWHGYQPLGLKKETQATNNNIYSNGKQEFREQSSPLSLSDRLAVNHETVHDETSSNGNKDEEDDDDDESEDKMDAFHHDPERLKAFNMFVRLFVDENLDRMVPISKQPKEKIQAIIDSCTRQFPEFAERARKRIRTYLKSCRRNKRSRDGWESSRPTPAHLTSVQAEQILAQACENESQNAKRMRMGLSPVSEPLPMPVSESRGSKEQNGHHHTSSSSGESSNQEKPSKGSHSSSSANNSNIAATIAAVASNTATATSHSPSSTSISANVSNEQNINLALNGTNGSIGDSLVDQHVERSPLVEYSRTLNGNGAGANLSMYRPAAFSPTFQRPSPFPSLFPAVNSSTVIGALGNPTFPPAVSPLANGDVGPTDLSMKSKPLLSQKLNSAELSTVRQLITGYRESAAFLLRSADELEQLLIQQQ